MDAFPCNNFRKKDLYQNSSIWSMHSGLRCTVSCTTLLLLTQLFFPKPPTPFLTYICRGERRKYAGKKVRLNRGSNSQLLGHNNTLVIEPPGRGKRMVGEYGANQSINQPTKQQLKSSFHLHVKNRADDTLTLSQTTKFWFELVEIERICRRQNKIKTKICFGRGRNHCGKRRKSWLQVFLLFSCFQKTSFSRSLKIWIVW